MQAMVKELKADEAVLSTGEVLPYGIAVWSTGVGPTSFTTGLEFAKTARGRIAVDEELRVLRHVDPAQAKHTELQKPGDVSLDPLTVNAACWQAALVIEAVHVENM